MEEKGSFSLYFILDDGNEDKAAVNMSFTISDAFPPGLCRESVFFFFFFSSKELIIVEIMQRTVIVLHMFYNCNTTDDLSVGEI